MNAFDPRDGRVLDWDALLFGEIPIVGRDFELLVPAGNLELFRGPMGTTRRVADEVLFEPVLVVIWRHGDPDQHIGRPSRENAPRVRLTDHRLIEMPDLMLVVIDRITREPLYALHAPGDNLTLPNLFGSIPLG